MSEATQITTDTAPEAPLRRAHETSPDRVGWAIAAGGAAIGLLAMLTLIHQGSASPRALVIGSIAASFIGALGITAIGGPIWLALHCAGLRAAHHMASAAAICGFLFWLVMQRSVLLGISEDNGTATYRWASVLGTSALLSIISVMIALMMWRIAYRRVA